MAVKGCHSMLLILLLTLTLTLTLTLVLFGQPQSHLPYIYTHIHLLHRLPDGSQAVLSLHYTHTHKYIHTPSSQTPRWLSSDVTQRFSPPECLETRTWEELARVMRDKQDMFTSGSLGAEKTENFLVWACFKEHTCLSVISHPDGDAMCYVYHESQKKWYPMGLSSEVFDECSA
jgi:hypothetical protein